MSERLRERPQRVSEGHGCCWSSSWHCDKGGASVSRVSFQDCSTRGYVDNGPDPSPDGLCIKNHAQVNIIELHHLRVGLKQRGRKMYDS